MLCAARNTVLLLEESLASFQNVFPLRYIVEDTSCGRNHLARRALFWS